MNIPFRENTNHRGMALLLTLIILAVMSIMAATFVTNMSIDSKISYNINTEASAEYIAKAGLGHAIGVLRQDADFITPNASFEKYDWNTDNTSYNSDDWVTLFLGSDVDVAQTITRSTGQIASGKKDSRWIYLHEKPDDSSSPIIGRYAVLIQDENAKININTAGSGHDAVEANQQGESVNEIDIEDLFDKLPSLNSALASAITTYSGKPYGELEELYKITGLGSTEFNSLNPYFTIYSADHDLYYDTFHSPNGFAIKVNVNYDPRINVYRENLFNHLSWANPVKECLASINIFDYRDTDNVPVSFSETELDLDINGDGSKSSSTYVFGTEGIQINEILPEARVIIQSTNAAFVSKQSGNFSPSGQYYIGTSTDASNIASATFQIPWDNGTFKIKVYSKNEAFSDSISCKVEGVGFDTVPAAGSKEFSVNVTDGNITIELEDPLQYEADGSLSSTQIPSKFDKVEIDAGEFIEIVNISRKSITITSGWTFVLDNGTPANPADDRTYHIGSDVTLNGTAYIATADPKRVSYDCLILTDSEKALDILFGTTPDGTWDGTASVRIPIDTTNSATFSILTAGTDTITVKNQNNNLIDIIAPTNPNDYCISGFNQSGAVSPYTSREKISPDYDLKIGTTEVWQNSTNAGNESGFFATPGSANTSTNSYVTIKDDLIPNMFFIYDMPKNEHLNDPNGALTSAINYTQTLNDMIGFVTYDAAGANYYRKTNWALTAGYLTLPSTVVSGSKITWKCDPASENVPDGNYRIFINGKQTDEIHKIKGIHLDLATSTTSDMEISATMNGQLYLCANGSYDRSDLVSVSDEQKHRFDKLLPFTVSQNLISIEDNCDASTPITLNTLNTAIFQPAGFDPAVFGRININTADIYILQTLPEVDTALAQAILNLSVTTPFTSTSDLLNVPGISFSQFCKIANLVTVRSNTFKINVVGQNIRDVNRNGGYDSNDIVLGEKRCSASVYRKINVNQAQIPSGIKVYTRYFSWEK